MSGITLSLRRQIWREQQGRCWYCDIPLEPPKALKLSDEEVFVNCVCLNCQLAHQGTPRVSNGMGDSARCIRGQLDHVVPRAFDGSDQRDNLVYACTVCNQVRLNDIQEFRHLHRRQAHPGVAPIDCPECRRAFMEMKGFASEREQRERSRGVLPPDVVARSGRWVAGGVHILGSHEEVVATEPAAYAKWLEMQESARRWSVISHYRDAMDELWHVEWDSLLNDLFAAGFTAMQINSEIDRLHTSKRARAKGLTSFIYVHAALLGEPREHSRPHR